MEDRQTKLLELIEEATGKPVYSGEIQEEGYDVEAENDVAEANYVITAS